MGGGVHVPTPIYFGSSRKSGGTPEPPQNKDLIAANGWLPVQYGGIWYNLSGETLRVWDSFELSKCDGIHLVLTPPRGDDAVFSGICKFGVRGLASKRHNSTLALLLHDRPIPKGTSASVNTHLTDVLIDWQGSTVINPGDFSEVTYQNKALIHLPNASEYILFLIVPALADTVLTSHLASAGHLTWPIAQNAPNWDYWGPSMAPIYDRDLDGPLGIYDIEIHVEFQMIFNHGSGGSDNQILTPTKTTFVKNSFTPA